MRINNQLLADIVNEVINGTLKVRLSESYEARAAQGDRILARVLERDGSVEPMQKLPPHYFAEKDWLKIRIMPNLGVGRVCLMSEVDSSTDDYKNSEVLKVRIHDAKLYAHNYTVWHVFDKQDTDIIAYCTLDKAVSQLIDGQYKAEQDLITMLKPFKSIKALLTALPEFKQYIPAEALEPPVKALAVRVEDITNYVSGLRA